MARIPGTSFHDDDPPEPNVEALQNRIAFYEGILKTMPPHSHDGTRCKVARKKGLGCCNPRCNGTWGTGCWCCHHGSFAVGAATEDITAYLALVKSPQMEMNMGTTSETTPKPASEATGTAQVAADATVTKAALPNISGDDFAKVDLRIGTITKAERVVDADKLLKLEVDFGGLGTRTIAAGIAQDFEPEKILNMQVVAVVNLPPRTLRGVESNGMILAARGADGKLCLVTCPGTNGAKVG